MNAIPYSLAIARGCLSPRAVLSACLHEDPIPTKDCVIEIVHDNEGICTPTMPYWQVA